LKSCRGLSPALVSFPNQYAINPVCAPYSDLLAAHAVLLYLILLYIAVCFPLLSALFSPCAVFARQSCSLIKEIHLQPPLTPVLDPLLFPSTLRPGCTPLLPTGSHLFAHVIYCILSPAAVKLPFLVFSSLCPARPEQGVVPVPGEHHEGELWLPCAVFLSASSVLSSFAVLNTDECRSYLGFEYLGDAYFFVISGVIVPHDSRTYPPFFSPPYIIPLMLRSLGR